MKNNIRKNTVWLSEIDWMDKGIIARLQAAENTMRKADDGQEIAIAITGLRAAPENALKAALKELGIVVKSSNSYEDPSFSDCLNNPVFKKLFGNPALLSEVRNMKNIGNGTAHVCKDETMAIANSYLRTALRFIHRLCAVVGRPDIPAFQFTPVENVGHCVVETENEELKKTVEILKAEQAKAEKAKLEIASAKERELLAVAKTEKLEKEVEAAKEELKKQKAEFDKKTADNYNDFMHAFSECCEIEAARSKALDKANVRIDMLESLERTARFRAEKLEAEKTEANNSAFFAGIASSILMSKFARR